MKKEEIAKMAANILDLGVKKPSQKLQDLINGMPIAPFQKLKTWKDEVFKIARSEGFDDMEIGRLIRQIMKTEYSDRTIQRILPDTAKHTEFTNKADKMSASAFEIPAVVIPPPSSKVLNNTVQEPSRPGKYNIAPNEYEIEKLDEYEPEYVKEVVKFQAGSMETLDKVVWESDTMIDKLNNKIRKLEEELKIKDKRIAELESYLEGFNKKLKDGISDIRATTGCGPGVL